MISIDVIIANFNNGRYLKQCIDSVLSQTLKPTEIIVVDDASTDESLQILEPYVKEGSITLLKNDATIGVTLSRIRAIAHGKSEFITTLDADDYYHNRYKLELEARVISEYGPSTIAFSDVIRVNETGGEIFLVSTNRKLREGDLDKYIRNLRGFIPRDYLVSRANYIATGGYDPNLNIYEDWDLKIRLSQQCFWYFSGIVGTAYRINPKGLSRSPLKHHIKVMRQIFWKNCDQKSSIFKFISISKFFLYHSLYLKRLAI